MRTHPEDYISLGKVYYRVGNYEAADAAFSRFVEMEPKIVRGYLWRARAKSGIDQESRQGLARQDYKRVIKLGSRDEETYRKDLVEAYEYLGYYYYVRERHSKSKFCWKKVLEIEPGNQDVRVVLDSLPGK